MYVCVRMINHYLYIYDVCEGVCFSCLPAGAGARAPSRKNVAKELFCAQVQILQHPAGNDSAVNGYCDENSRHVLQASCFTSYPNTRTFGQAISVRISLTLSMLIARVCGNFHTSICLSLSLSYLHPRCIRRRAQLQTNFVWWRSVTAVVLSSARPHVHNVAAAPRVQMDMRLWKQVSDYFFFILDANATNLLAIIHIRPCCIGQQP